MKTAHAQDGFPKGLDGMLDETALHGGGVIASETMRSRGILAFVVGVASLAACSNGSSSTPGGDSSATTTSTTASSTTATASASTSATTTASLMATTSTTTTAASSTTSSSTTGAGSGGRGGAGATGVGGTGAGGVGGAGVEVGGAAGELRAAVGPMAAFTLSSTGFTEGTAIPVKYTCKGSDVSPDLTWTAGPAGTLSYAVVLTDKSNMLVHWAIWDIPSTVTSLPENLEQVANPTAPAGSKQTKTPQGNASGYYGPCPPTCIPMIRGARARRRDTPSVTTNSNGSAVAPVVESHAGIGVADGHLHPLAHTGGSAPAFPPAVGQARRVGAADNEAEAIRVVVEVEARPFGESW